MNLAQSERKKHWAEVIEAFRENEEGGKPKVVCETCLKAFPYWTLAAQEHVLKGGCVPRPNEHTLKNVEVN